MSRNLIKNCWHQLSSEGIEVDEQLLKIVFKDTLSSGETVLILLLDGQEFLWRVGRFAYFEFEEFEAPTRILSWAVFESLNDYTIKVLHQFPDWKIHKFDPKFGLEKNLY